MRLCLLPSIPFIIAFLLSFPTSVHTLPTPATPSSLTCSSQPTTSWISILLSPIFDPKNPIPSILRSLKFNNTLDRMPDFSFAGYRAGTSGLPDRRTLKILTTLTPTGDQTDRTSEIQSALDSAAQNSGGGVVLLKSGEYHLSANESLNIRGDGVVLRGEPGAVIRPGGVGRPLIIIGAPKIGGGNGHPATTTGRGSASSSASISKGGASGVAGGNVTVRSRTSSAETTLSVSVTASTSSDDSFAAVLASTQASASSNGKRPSSTDKSPSRATASSTQSNSSSALYRISASARRPSPDAASEFSGSITLTPRLSISANATSIASGSIAISARAVAPTPPPSLGFASLSSGDLSNTPSESSLAQSDVEMSDRLMDDDWFPPGLSFLAVAPSASNSTAGDVPNATSAWITDQYVPVGSKTIHVSSVAPFKLGDEVLVSRNVTSKWVQELEMDSLVRNGKKQTWMSASSRIDQPRTICSIDFYSNAITLDIPLTDSIDTRFDDRGVLSLAPRKNRVRESGIEDIEFVLSPSQSGFNISTRFFTVFQFDLAQDCWARNINATGFLAFGAFGQDSVQNTLQDSVFVRDRPTSNGGKGALPLDVTLSGTRSLVLRCETKGAEGTNTFVIGTQARTPGPNVVIGYKGNITKHTIAPHQRWAHGALFESCEVGEIELANRGILGSGQGWSIGMGVIWNSTANTLQVQQPPTSQNFAVGTLGKLEPSSSQVSIGRNSTGGTPGGSKGTRSQVPSLFRWQLERRVGRSIADDVLGAGYGIV